LSRTTAAAGQSPLAAQIRDGETVLELSPLARIATDILAAVLPALCERGTELLLAQRATVEDFDGSAHPQSEKLSSDERVPDMYKVTATRQHRSTP
jgi:hypothetical protein